MDISGITPGVDFVDSIQGAIDASKVLIPLIGPLWLTSKSSSGELRLNDPRDFVRIEIRTALERGLTVIPVLLSGAKMPAAEDLPPDLAPLAHRQGLQLTDADLDQNIRTLIRALELELRPPSGAGRRFILQSSRIAIPIALLAAAVLDLALPSTALTPLVALAFAALGLAFAAPKLAAPYIDSQQWPQLIRNQNKSLRIGVFLLAMAAAFTALAIAQKISGVDRSRGILASKITALGIVKAGILVPKDAVGANAKLPAIEPSTNASSPSASGMWTNSGWLVTFNIPDRRPKEILYKLNAETTFTSTGFSHQETDQVTGLPRPNYYVTLPSLGQLNVISLKYIDERGQEHGPFSLPFDTHQQYLNETKDIMESIPQWVSFSQDPKDKKLAYFTTLVSYQNAFREIRYSIDNESVSQKWPIRSDWDAPGRIPPEEQTYLEIPTTAKFVCVQLIFIDGTQSPVKKFTIAGSIPG